MPNTDRVSQTNGSTDVQNAKEFVVRRRHAPAHPGSHALPSRQYLRRKAPTYLLILSRHCLLRLEAARRVAHLTKGRHGERTTMDMGHGVAWDRERYAGSAVVPALARLSSLPGTIPYISCEPFPRLRVTRCPGRCAGGRRQGGVSRPKMCAGLLNGLEAAASAAPWRTAATSAPSPASSPPSTPSNAGEVVFPVLHERAVLLRAFVRGRRGEGGGGRGQLVAVSGGRQEHGDVARALAARSAMGFRSTLSSEPSAFARRRRPEPVRAAAVGTPLGKLIPPLCSLIRVHARCHVPRTATQVSTSASDIEHGNATPAVL